MSLRIAGRLLIAAAMFFWVSWFLMPGVGVTDAAQIFALVAPKRPSVMLSVITQLLSAALYVPALLGICCSMGQKQSSKVYWSTGLLLLGAMGSAMDAVFHLLAYAMTAPGLEPRSLLQVMTFMQGPALRLVAPFILSFFLGGVWLSVSLVRKGTLSKASVYAYLAALAFGVIGAASASGGIASSRAVGLLVLGAVSLAQASLGLELSLVPDNTFEQDRFRKQRE
jgi:hypothetical protein